MKFPNSRSIHPAALCLGAVLLSCGSSVVAQDPAGDDDFNRNAYIWPARTVIESFPGPNGPITRSRPVIAGDLIRSPAGNPYGATVYQVPQNIRASMQQLREADSDDAKATARDGLRADLGNYFDEDLKSRRAELDRLIKRADRSEELLETRARSREELIDLQVKSTTYSADGLSLFEGQLAPEPDVIAVAPQAPQAWQVQRSGAAQVARAPVTFSYATDSVPHTVTVPAAEKNDNPREDALEKVNRASRNLVGIDWKEDSEKKQQVIDELRSALGEYFDADMTYRREELKKVRDGLKTMESGIEKRADAREDIIALQMKVSENEAMGLGFFSGGSGRTTRFAPAPGTIGTSYGFPVPATVPSPNPTAVREYQLPRPTGVSTSGGR